MSQFHLDFLLQAPCVDLVYVSRDISPDISVLSALRFPGLFYVHHSDLNRITKLTNVFSPTCYFMHLCYSRRKKKITILILSSTSHDLKTFKTHLSAQLLGGQFHLSSALRITSSVSSLASPLKKNNFAQEKMLLFFSGT